jgi:hypothetical protein
MRRLGCRVSKSFQLKAVDSCIRCSTWPINEFHERKVLDFSRACCQRLADCIKARYVPYSVILGTKCDVNVQDAASLLRAKVNADLWENISPKA